MMKGDGSNDCDGSRNFFFHFTSGSASRCQREARQAKEGGNRGGIRVEENWREIHVEEKWSRDGGGRIRRLRVRVPPGMPVSIAEGGLVDGCGAASNEVRLEDGWHKGGEEARGIGEVGEVHDMGGCFVHSSLPLRWWVYGRHYSDNGQPVDIMEGRVVDSYGVVGGRVCPEDGWRKGGEEARGVREVG